MDIRDAAARDREVRLERAAQITRRDPRDGETGTGFGGFERKQVEQNDRIRQHKIDQYVEFHRRRFGSDPSTDQVAAHLGESTEQQ